jgi:F0F1-type ATP synthase assembly protein I
MTKLPGDPAHDHDEDERFRESVLVPANELQASFRRASSVAAASYTLIGAIMLLGGFGYFADRWLATDPWLLIGGLFLGIVVGFYELARVVWRRIP